MRLALSAAAATFLFASASAQAELTVQMHAVSEKGVGEPIGNVTIRESRHGLVFEPDLSGLSPGLHGFHLHQNPSCEPAVSGGKVTPAGAAGGHHDPKNTNRHGAPWGDGHLGDLPALYAGTQGNAVHPVLAPRLTMADLLGRALVVHQGGDNYADQPEPLGGGGARVACGVIRHDRSRSRPQQMSEAG